MVLIRSLLGAVMVAVLSFSAVALAGNATANEVFLYTGIPGHVGVSGAVDAARYSADSNQYIGCILWDSGAIRCSATDAYNTYVYCNISAATAAQQALVAGINRTSSISFDVTTATHVCSGLSVSNISYNIH